MDTTKRDILRRNQFAEYMGVKPRTVDAWIRRGKITRHVQVGGRNYFKIDECLEEMGLTRAEWEQIRDDFRKDGNVNPPSASDVKGGQENA